MKKKEKFIKVFSAFILLGSVFLINSKLPKVDFFSYAVNYSTEVKKTEPVLQPLKAQLANFGLINRPQENEIKKCC